MTNEEKKINRAEIENAQSMVKIVWSQFKDHKMAVVGLFVVSIFMFIALSAPLLASLIGIGPDDQNVFNRYKPVLTSLTTPTDQKESLTTDWINKNPTEVEAFQKELVAKSIFSNVAPNDVLFELTAKEPQEILSLIKDTHPPKSFIKMVKSFETFHILGTDELGRDVLVRLLYGTRVSIGVGLLVAIASALIGLIIGCFAGYYGGVWDNILMRVTDGLLSLPLLPVLIVFAAIDFSKAPLLRYLVTTENQAVMKLVVVLCLTSWMWVARLVRGSILSLKEREFILAAKTLGARDTTIMLRHIAPNVVAPLLVSVTLGVGESILFEAALSFLGLGIQPPTPSWGNMLFNAQELIYEAPLLAILPGLLILATTISFNYIGDGLQDAIDPKAIRR
jgi:peptide/nickel transport system permease protein